MGASLNFYASTTNDAFIQDEAGFEGTNDHLAAFTTEATPNGSSAWAGWHNRPAHSSADPVQFIP